MATLRASGTRAPKPRKAPTPRPMYGSGGGSVTTTTGGTPTVTKTRSVAVTPKATTAPKSRPGYPPPGRDASVPRGAKGAGKKGMRNTLSTTKLGAGPQRLEIKPGGAKGTRARTRGGVSLNTANSKSAQAGRKRTHK